jgi:putative transposase
MSKPRTRYSAQCKFQLALEAAKGLKTINELASEPGVHPKQVSEWKRRLLEVGNTIFSRDGVHLQRAHHEQAVALYEHIGRLKMELEWLKKKLPASVAAKRAMIDLGARPISIRRQCELLGWHHSTFYDAPATASTFNLQLMRLIDEQYPTTPFDGWPRMTAYVRRLGLLVHHQRVQRLMRVMGLQAMYPKPRTSTAAQAHQIYPYLLGAVAMRHPNQGWSADST